MGQSPIGNYALRLTRYKLNKALNPDLRTTDLCDCASKYHHKTAK